MEIKGPLKIRVVENPEAADWELLVDFRDEFRQLELAEQSMQFRLYLQDLHQSLAATELDGANRQGILLVQQLVEQLLPYIEAGELALHETIAVQIAQSDAVHSLNDLINASSL